MLLDSMLRPKTITDGPYCQLCTDLEPTLAVLSTPRVDGPGQVTIGRNCMLRLYEELASYPGLHRVPPRTSWPTLPPPRAAELDQPAYLRRS